MAHLKKCYLLQYNTKLKVKEIFDNQKIMKSRLKKGFKINFLHFSLKCSNVNQEVTENRTHILFVICAV